MDREGISILFSTHITTDLDKTADDITYIKNGEIVASQEKEFYIDSYRMVEGVTNLLSEPFIKQKIIGFHDRKGEFSGLLRKEDAENLQGFKISPANLESIMVYTERRLTDE